MKLSEEFELFEEQYKVYVEHRGLDRRGTVRILTFGYVFISLFGLLMKMILFPFLPLSYIFIGVIFAAIGLAAVIYLERTIGAKGVFGITHNTVEIGISFKNLGIEPWYLPEVHLYRLDSIEEILFDPNKSNIIFRLVGQKNRSFAICDEIPKEIVIRMLAIATKDSGTPYRIGAV